VPDVRLLQSLGQSRARRCVAAVAVVIGLLSPATLPGVRSSVSAQSRQPRVREILWDPLTPIARQLIAGDEVVIIRPIDGDAITPGVRLTVKQVIEDVALRSDIVAVIDLDTIEGLLSRDDSWVDTRVAGTVRDVLRVSKNHRIARGQHIEAWLYDGTAMVGNVVVKAGRWEHPAQLHAHSSCLLFLRDAEEGMLRDEYLPLIVKDGTVMHTLPAPPGDRYAPPHPFQGLRVSDVARIVRDARTSWVCGSCDTAAKCHVYCAGGSP
jgi:hypothetical protein